MGFMIIMETDSLASLASCDDLDEDGEGEWNMTFPACEGISYLRM